LYDNRALLRAAVVMSPSGLAAIVAGWITTEVGRQPYTVYGLLRTTKSAAPLDAGTVGATLVAFVIVYFAVFGAGLVYMLRLMARPPLPSEPPLDETATGPLRAAGITPVAAIDPDVIPHA
jgi:cytochrome d ubiquinol oxidase subunit I